jgi:pimeloyl-ACP methyl ester carboxylesterase
MKTIVRFLLLVLAVALLAPSSTAAAPPSLAFTAETADGVTIRGHLHRRGGDALVVYCHSLLRNEEHVDPTRLLDALGPRYDLATFDFRGHSSSFGSSTEEEKRSSTCGQ